MKIQVPKSAPSAYALTLASCIKEKNSQVSKYDVPSVFNVDSNKNEGTHSASIRITEGQSDLILQ